MRKYLAMIVSLYVLSFATLLFAKESQQQSEVNYFENYPSSWSVLNKQGKATIIAARAANQRVQAIIKPHNKKQSAYKYDYCLNILVNDKKINVPTSVYCSLNDLNRGKVFIEENRMILMLDGGDGAAGYVVQIEFDNERVKRMSVFADSSLGPDVLLEETNYYVATYN